MDFKKYKYKELIAILVLCLNNRADYGIYAEEVKETLEQREGIADDPAEQTLTKQDFINFFLKE